MMGVTIAPERLFNWFNLYRYIIVIINYIYKTVSANRFNRNEENIFRKGPLDAEKIF